MFNIHVGSSLHDSFQNFQVREIFNNISQHDLFDRIKKVVQAGISKIIEVGQELKKNRETANLKTIAIIGCVGLIAILAVSIFRRGNSNNNGLMPPPTPAPTNKNKQTTFDRSYPFTDQWPAGSSGKVTLFPSPGLVSSPAQPATPHSSSEPAAKKSLFKEKED